jgi:hypothetical protein
MAKTISTHSIFSACALSSPWISSTWGALDQERSLGHVEIGVGVGNTLIVGEKQRLGAGDGQRVPINAHVEGVDGQVVKGGDVVLLGRQERDSVGSYVHRMRGNRGGGGLAGRLTREGESRPVAGEGWLGTHSRGSEVNLAIGGPRLGDEIVGARPWDEASGTQAIAVGQVNLDTVEVRGYQTDETQ